MKRDKKNTTGGNEMRRDGQTVFIVCYFLYFAGWPAPATWYTRVHSIKTKKRNDSVYVLRIFIIADKWFIKRSVSLGQQWERFEGGCCLLFVQCCLFWVDSFVRLVRQVINERLWIVCDEVRTPHRVVDEWRPQTVRAYIKSDVDSNKLINTSDAKLAHVRKLLHWGIISKHAIAHFKWLFDYDATESTFWPRFSIIFFFIPFISLRCWFYFRCFDSLVRSHKEAIMIWKTKANGMLIDLRGARSTIIIIFF